MSFGHYLSTTMGGAILLQIYYIVGDSSFQMKDILDSALPEYKGKKVTRRQISGALSHAIDLGILVKLAQSRYIKQFVTDMIPEELRSPGNHDVYDPDGVYNMKKVVIEMLRKIYQVYGTGVISIADIDPSQFIEEGCPTPKDQWKRLLTSRLYTVAQRREFLSHVSPLGNSVERPIGYYKFHEELVPEDLQSIFGIVSAPKKYVPTEYLRGLKSPPDHYTYDQQEAYYLGAATAMEDLGSALMGRRIFFE